MATRKKKTVRRRRSTKKKVQGLIMGVHKNLMKIAKLEKAESKLLRRVGKNTNPFKYRIARRTRLADWLKSHTKTRKRRK